MLGLLQHGLTNKEIGQVLGISPHTVRDHISGMLARYGFKGRAALAALYISKSAIGGADPLEKRTSATERRSSPVSADPQM